MLSTIWDDIDNDCDAITITEINYKYGSLSNNIYEVLYNKAKLKILLKNNKGLFSQIQSIQAHKDTIISNPKVLNILPQLFSANNIVNITAIDLLFINCYYRKLLRGKLEKDLIGKGLPTGLIITDNAENDVYIVETLRLLRVICNFLNVSSTTDENSFHIDKIDNLIFWSSISEKFLRLFGEERITVVKEYIDSLPDSELYVGSRTEIMVLLNVIFNMWSGSTLVVEKDTVKIIPATYMKRMLPLLL